MLVTPLVQIEGFFFQACYSLASKENWMGFNQRLHAARRALEPFNFYNSQFKKIVCI